MARGKNGSGKPGPRICLDRKTRTFSHPPHTAPAEAARLTNGVTPQKQSA